MLTAAGQRRMVWDMAAGEPHIGWVSSWDRKRYKQVIVVRALLAA